MKPEDLYNGWCESCGEENFIMAVSRNDPTLVCFGCSLTIADMKFKSFMKMVDDITNREKRNKKAFDGFISKYPLTFINDNGMVVIVNKPGIFLARNIKDQNE